MGGTPSLLPVPARLVEHVVGEEAGARIVELVDVPPALAGADDSESVPRASIAMGVALALFADLLERVPSAASYAADRRAKGGRIRLDHGAVRTLQWPSGRLPAGQESVARLLRPLGFEQRETYDLSSLRMTGRSWAHVDHPELVPQWFVSELHVERLSLEVQQAVTAMTAMTPDPLRAADRERLRRLDAEHALPFDDAVAVVAAVARCFARHHAEPTDRDHDLFLRESVELAWIATEGTTCNHWTDRVADVAVAAEAERAAGRPIKDTIEVSASGRVRQTAHRAALVDRRFHTVEGDRVVRQVPGSFFELIQREPLPDGSGLDLAFDAANATGIFAMTRPAGSR
jgi:hypothetical protein